MEYSMGVSQKIKNRTLNVLFKFKILKLSNEPETMWNSTWGLRSEFPPPSGWAFPKICVLSSQFTVLYLIHIPLFHVAQPPGCHALPVHPYLSKKTPSQHVAVLPLWHLDFCNIWDTLRTLHHLLNHPSSIMFLPRKAAPTPTACNCLTRALSWEQDFQYSCVPHLAPSWEYMVMVS